MVIEIYSLLTGMLLGGLLTAGLMYWWSTKKYQRIHAELVRASAASVAREEIDSQRNQEISRLREKEQDKQSELIRLHGELKKLETQIQSVEETAKNRKEAILQLEEALGHSFEKTASSALVQNARLLADNQELQLKSILDPLKMQLHQFESKVEEVYEKEARERLLMKREIEQLAHLHTQMSEDARNLTQALKGDVKFQGDWGEMILSKILEQCGLRPGIEYILQGKDLQLKDEQGRHKKPDVIINLPEQKHIIIDAKVSLTAYEYWVNAEDTATQKESLAKLSRSFLNHIKRLGEQDYFALEGLHSPDIVLMFVPIEPAFSLVLQHQPDLLQRAWSHNVVLVTPSSLLATLKTVASLWKLAYQSQNAREIARMGGKLHDKLVAFVAEIEKIGQQLDLASRAYAQSMRKLRDGRGAIISQAEQLKALGADTTKSFEK